MSSITAEKISSLPYVHYPISNLDKVARVLKSPMFLTLILISGTLISGLYSFNIEPIYQNSIVGILSLITICYAAKNVKKILYTISLIKSLTRNYFFPEKYSWWNKIDEYVYLGAIPLESKNHPTQLSHLGIQNFVSLVEPFEFEPSLVGSPIAYAKNSKNVLLLPSPDYVGVQLEDLKTGVEWIQSKVLEKQAVYVHCKAGVGRSAILVACHQYKYGTNSKNGQKWQSADEVETYLKEEKRSTINMNRFQKAALAQYCIHVNQERAST